MTTICAFVPHIVRRCPGFAACFRALRAKAKPIFGGSHGRYSWLMTWRAAR
jgi:hypothetical protein